MALAPATVRPAPFASEPEVAFAATVMLRSSTFNDSVLIVVVLPSTVKLPPMNRLPLIPAPPVITKAPVDIEPDSTPLVIARLPESETLVNAPVEAAFAPIGVSSMYPPVSATFEDITFPLNVPYNSTLDANKLAKRPNHPFTWSAVTYVLGVTVPPGV